MRIVQKYGGSSLADAECINRVADRIARTYQEGKDIVVVLSAQGKTTNDLILKAKELNKTPTQRELDMLLVTGEQQSVALMSLALSSRGCPSVSLNAFQAGIYSDGIYGSARITEIDQDRIISELDAKKIVIITGFQAVQKNREFTTLGRGGSDTSAVAIAKVIRASRCEIYSDVEGIYTADPRIVKNAKKLVEIDYDSMLELASLGANVLHNRAVEMAKKFNVPLYILSSFTERTGTMIQNQPLEKTLISGIVVDKDIATVSLIGLSDKPGIAYTIFSALAVNGVSVDIILQSVGRDNTKDMVFTIKEEDIDKVEALLQNEAIETDEIIINREVAKLSVVGAGLEANPHIGAAIFETLYKNHINIDMISTSEIKMSLIIDKNKATQGVKALHNRLIEENLTKLG